MAVNPVAYETVATAKASDAVYRKALITSLSAGTGAGKTFAVQHFASKVVALPTDALERAAGPTGPGALSAPFVAQEIQRLKDGDFAVASLNMRGVGCGVRPWSAIVKAVVLDLGLDDDTTVQLNAIKPDPATAAQERDVNHTLHLLSVVAKARWTRATKTLFVFIDEAMANGLEFMRALRKSLVGVYVTANESLQSRTPALSTEEKWDSLPRIQLVLVGAKLADRHDDASGSSAHRWLSVPPLTIDAITAIRQHLLREGWLPVRRVPMWCKLCSVAFPHPVFSFLHSRRCRSTSSTAPTPKTGLASTRTYCNSPAASRAPSWWR